MMITKPGIYLGMSARDYFDDPAPEPSLTQSIAKILIDRSPAHAKLMHPRLNPDFQAPFEYDRAQAIGNAAHKLLIGRGKDVCIIDANDFRKEDARSERDAAIRRGLNPILEKHMVMAQELVEAAKRQLSQIDSYAFAGPGNGEAVIAWEEDGIWLRSMIDWLWLDGNRCYDLKTSGLSAAPHSVPNIMASAGWPIQAAIQKRGLDVLDHGGAGRRKFFFVMVENSPPYALTVHEMSEAVMTVGMKQLDYAIRIWRKCIETGSWPAYPPLINHPEYPGYAEAKWLNREIAESDRAHSDQEWDAGNIGNRMMTDLMGG